MFAMLDLDDDGSITNEEMAVWSANVGAEFATPLTGLLLACAGGAGVDITFDHFCYILLAHDGVAMSKGGEAARTAAEVRCVRGGGAKSAAAASGL